MKNGIFPVVLAEAVVVRLVDALAEAPEVTVDLESDTIGHSAIGAHAFHIDPFRREMLLGGKDDISWTEAQDARIVLFEERQRAAEPWLWAQRGR